MMAPTAPGRLRNRDGDGARIALRVTAANIAALRSGIAQSRVWLCAPKQAQRTSWRPRRRLTTTAPLKSASSAASSRQPTPRVDGFSVSSAPTISAQGMTIAAGPESHVGPIP